MLSHRWVLRFAFEVSDLIDQRGTLYITCTSYLVDSTFKLRRLLYQVMFNEIDTHTFIPATRLDASFVSARQHE